MARTTRIDHIKRAQREVIEWADLLGSLEAGDPRFSSVLFEYTASIQRRNDLERQPKPKRGKLGDEHKIDWSRPDMQPPR